MEASNHNPADDLTLLWVPVPPYFAETMGYTGTTRLIAFYWSFSVDELAFDDGNRRGVGESLPFLDYAGHENVECELTMDIGLFDQPATHWLLLDRQTENLYAGVIPTVQRLLEQQHDRANQTQPEVCQIELADEYREVMEEQSPRHEQLVRFLDRWKE